MGSPSEESKPLVMLYVFKSYYFNDPEILEDYLQDPNLSKAKEDLCEDNMQRCFEGTVSNSKNSPQATHFLITEKKSFSSTQLNIFVDWCQPDTLNQCYLLGSDLKPIEAVAATHSAPQYLPTGSEVSGVYYGDINQDALPEVIIVLNTGGAWLFESKAIHEPQSPPAPNLSPGLQLLRRLIFQSAGWAFRWIDSISKSNET